MSDPSGSRNGKPPLRSPRQVACPWDTADDVLHLLIQTLSLSEKPYTDRSDVVPSPEQNEYFNKQSGKVNAGLGFDDSLTLGEDDFKGRRRGPLATKNALVAHVDFSQFSVPTTASPLASAPLSTEELVQTLLQPPAHAFLHGMLSIQWVLGSLGHHHFVFQQNDERYVLRPDSDVRTKGQRLGLPPVYLDWLCGDQQGSSPTEQAMMLTKEFFEALYSSEA